MDCLKAYTDAFNIAADATEAQLADAATRLVRGDVVLLDDTLALRPSANQLYCEVIDPDPQCHRCAMEYEVLIENARRKLESSGLHGLLPDLPCHWVVVDQHGNNTHQL